MPVAKKMPSLPARPQKNKYKSSWDDIVSGAIVAGLFYGLLMDKGVSSLNFKGRSILNAFQFRSLALFKYYFLAVGASLIFMALIYYFSIFQHLTVFRNHADMISIRESFIQK